MNKEERKEYEQHLKTLFKPTGKTFMDYLLTNEEEQMIEKARLFGIEKHKGQLDDCGKDYFEAHVQQVANIVSQSTKDPDIIAAAYLHDTVEDTETTYEELIKEFNQRTADLVMEVTHEESNDNFGYYFPRLKTREGIMIKLADRLSNISRMDSWDIARREHYLKKTKFWKDGTERRR
jgi:(p)ppGpp synthase/HD superfamily hydrolase